MGPFGRRQRERERAARERADGAGRGQDPRRRNAVGRADEDPVVRQYRFLLRQAPPDAVEAAHLEALDGADGSLRRAVLTAVQDGLVAGQRLHPDDTAQLAHLVVHGERRTPNAFLTACDLSTLTALAGAVLDSEACFGLLAAYPSWDGRDPVDEAGWDDSGFNPDSGRWNLDRRPPQDDSGVIGYGGIPGAGGGGGGA